MNALDRVREKYKTPMLGTSKACKSPSAGSAGPQDRDSESYGGVIIDFDVEKARRDSQRRVEEKRKRLEPVLKMMAEDGEVRNFYLVTDDKSDPNYVFLSFAIPGKATGEMTIPQEEYDGFKLLETLEMVASGGGEATDE